jgi:hypothetical protein
MHLVRPPAVVPVDVDLLDLGVEVPGPVLARATNRRRPRRERRRHGDPQRHRHRRPRQPHPGRLGLPTETFITGSERAFDTVGLNTLAGEDDVFVAPDVFDLINPIVDLGPDA